MATNTAQYMIGRKEYGRPQAMLFSDNPGVSIDYNGQTYYIPDGYEIGYNNNLEKSFLILSDDNRSPIEFKMERIEERKRMINGRMRSYHIADKLNISTSWNLLPSRSFATDPNFNSSGQPTSLVTSLDHDNNPATANKTISAMGSAFYQDQQYTTDGGAGGVELLDWYENHPGSFWVFLSYDKYTNFETTTSNSQYNNLNLYSQVVEVFFSDFGYSVEKRGRSNFDFWNIQLSLEEV